LIATGHPWIEEYFNGPRGRAALASHDRNQASRHDTGAEG
jgi:phospholipid/cholesterol/gamma-HCH transport system ATP-binding protein